VLARCGQGYSLSDEGLAPVVYPMMRAFSADYPLPRKDRSRYALNPGKVGIPYFDRLTPSTGCGTYGNGGENDFSTTSGALPPALKGNSDGSISGTPTAAQDYSFTEKITASTASASQAYSIHIAP
jgi:hypothetical protein